MAMASLASLLNDEDARGVEKRAWTRVLIVTNRLPVTMTSRSKGDGAKEIEFRSSSGGVASVLAGLSDVWIGWPGDEVHTGDDRQVVVEKLRTLNCVPVFLSNELSHVFYNGFCNDLLWPLLHYMPLSMEAIRSHEKRFRAYEEANIRFAQVVLSHYQTGDVVWVHDYHLMLVPELLRRAQPDMQIGFFFHTSFPCSDVYAALPCRTELLRGVLNSNLVGFHTAEYLKHFQTSTTRLLNIQWNNERIRVNGIVSRLGVYPIGIDAQKFIETVSSHACQKHVLDFKSLFAGRKVLLGIDRLDYIKGILQKLLALESFLECHPDWIGKIILVQLAVPSRTSVPEYQTFKDETHKLVSRINGRFGSVANLPICYLDQSIGFEQMCALYRCADVMLVTSIRDGMNLVSHEYIACQKDAAGVLILSEFCGAAQLFDSNALRINPWNVNDVAQAIHKALTMDEYERRRLNNAAMQYISAHTAKDWAKAFLQDLPCPVPFSSVCPQQINDEKVSHMQVLLSKLSREQRHLLISHVLDLVVRVEPLNSAMSKCPNGSHQNVLHSCYQDVGELWGWHQSSVAMNETANLFASLDPLDALQNNRAEQTIIDTNDQSADGCVLDFGDIAGCIEERSTICNVLQNVV